MANSVRRQVRLKREKQTFDGHETLPPDGSFTMPRGTVKAKPVLRAGRRHVDGLWGLLERFTFTTRRRVKPNRR